MPEISDNLEAGGAVRHQRLLRLRDERFPPETRDIRVGRAIELLRTLPDSLRLSRDDARWIAENPDLEDS